MRINSKDKISFNWNSLISIRLENSLPINVKTRKYGVKPKNVEIINLDLEIYKVDKNKFWTNSGIPKIRRNKIKYSNEDFLTTLFNLSLNLSKYLFEYFLNIFWKKRKKQKLPKTIEIILIINPIMNPKKKLDANIIISPPGIEKAKNNNDKMKYIIKDITKWLLINKSNWINKLKIKSIIL